VAICNLVDAYEDVSANYALTSKLVVRVVVVIA